MKDSILVKKVVRTFQKKFSQNPLLFFSPGRINLIGEHTDYNDGFVFPAAIDKGIVVGIQKTNKDYCSVYSIDTNESFEFSLLEKIEPLEDGKWKNYILGIVGETQKIHKNLSNFELVFAGNIPLGAGLSSSAALENSIIFGLNELFHLTLTKTEMIFISQKAEHNYVNVKCGIMDQYASMFGEQNSAMLLDCRNLKAKTFSIDFQEHEILLINTNVKHRLAESAYNERRLTCEKVAELLGVNTLRDVSEGDLLTLKKNIAVEDYQKALYVVQENERVLKASKAIQENDFAVLGALLYASHDGLQNQFKVSCKELDFLVNAAKANKNIVGARMMGGGFGGCTINLIEKGKSKAFETEIIKLYRAEFNKEPSVYYVKIGEGTRMLD